ncbi:decarboxylating 6-phosphogluconate dehydrogenase [Candidatus Daviesbacteria bacterium]|nr:decarboxylating 6-phosphogluconate dehydrogenase [Candidatus Daviesbacteria bacterium]
MKLGYIGLGRMGKNMVLRLLEHGIEVVAWNRSKEPVEEVVKAGAIGAETIKDLVSKLETPRIIWLMLPAGEVTDQHIDELIPLLSPGDLVIDGANSFYKDSLRRAEKLAEKGINFMDIGVSGGPKGARNGACLMIGGNEEDFKKIEPLAKAAAAPGAYQYLGPAGSGHFAKMVHNAIEYGMMESIGEGLAILKFSQFKYDFVKLLDLYNHRSVIESRLVGWAKEAFEEDSKLSDTSSVIGSGGAGTQRVKAEGDWTVDLAKELGVDTPVLEDSMKVRSESAAIPEDSPNGFRNKVISALRGKFGQHAVKK